MGGAGKAPEVDGAVLGVNEHLPLAPRPLHTTETAKGCAAALALRTQMSTLEAATRGARMSFYHGVCTETQERTVI